MDQTSPTLSPPAEQAQGAVPDDVQPKISPTLLDAFDWYNNAPPSWKQKAYDDLVGKLERKPFFVTPAIQRGRDFEDAVQHVCETIQRSKKPGEIPIPGSKHFVSTVEKCLGGIWQTWKYGYLEVDGYGLVSGVGKLDVLFDPGTSKHISGKIIDLKTTGSFKRDKYVKGWQHKFYCLWTGITSFDYLVAEWADKDDPDSKEIKALHEIELTVDLEHATTMCQFKILEFYTFLQRQNLWETYIYTYCKNKR